MLKTREMLNMLNVGLENGPFWAHIFPKHLTYLTYLINISRVLRISWGKPFKHI